MDTETETVYSAVHVSSCDAVLFATRNFREKNDKEKKKKHIHFQWKVMPPKRNNSSKSLLVGITFVSGFFVFF